MTRNGILSTAGIFIFIGLLLSGCSSSPSGITSAGDINLDSLLLKAIKHSNDLRFEQASVELSQIIELSRQRGDHKNEIPGNLNTGALYIKYNAQEEALRYFMQSLELAQEYKREDFLNAIYNNIGIVYASNKATGKAVEYYNKALEISRRQDNKHRMALNLINLGTEMHNTGDDTIALRYFREAFRIFLYSDRDTLNASIALNNTADIYYDRQQYDSALALYRRAFAMSVVTKDNLTIRSIARGLARPSAGFTGSTLLPIILPKPRWLSRDIVYREHYREVYRLLAQIEDASGRPGPALRYANLTLAWKDSLLREKTSKWISEMQMRYEFGKKESQIEQLQEEATRQRVFGLLWW